MASEEPWALAPSCPALPAAGRLPLTSLFHILEDARILSFELELASQTGPTLFIL